MDVGKENFLWIMNFVNDLKFMSRLYEDFQKSMEG